MLVCLVILVFLVVLDVLVCLVCLVGLVIYLILKGFLLLLIVVTSNVQSSFSGRNVIQ